MTNEPKKGALRAAAGQRRARHAQRTPLPPRDGQFDETVAVALQQATRRLRDADERLGVAAKAYRDAQEHRQQAVLDLRAAETAYDAECKRTNTDNERN